MRCARSRECGLPPTPTIACPRQRTAAKRACVYSCLPVVTGPPPWCLAKVINTVVQLSPSSRLCILLVALNVCWFFGVAFRESCFVPKESGRCLFSSSRVINALRKNRWRVKEKRRKERRVSAKEIVTLVRENWYRDATIKSRIAGKRNKHIASAGDSDREWLSRSRARSIGNHSVEKQCSRWAWQVHSSYSLCRLCITLTFYSRCYLWVENYKGISIIFQLRQCWDSLRTLLRVLSFSSLQWLAFYNGYDFVYFCIFIPWYMFHVQVKRTI